MPRPQYHAANRPVACFRRLTIGYERPAQLVALPALAGAPVCKPLRTDVGPALTSPFSRARVHRPVAAPKSRWLGKADDMFLAPVVPDETPSWTVSATQRSIRNDVDGWGRDPREHGITSINPCKLGRRL